MRRAAAWPALETPGTPLGPNSGGTDGETELPLQLRAGQHPAQDIHICEGRAAPHRDDGGWSNAPPKQLSAGQNTVQNIESGATPRAGHPFQLI